MEVAQEPAIRARPAGWGGRDVVVGLLAAIGIFGLTNVAFLALATAFDLRLDVTGDDADVATVRLGLLTTAGYQLLLAAVAVVVSRQGLGGFIRATGLDRDPTRHLWRPVLAVIGAYVGVVLYAAIMQVVGPDILVPESTVPDAVANDTLTLLMSGVLAAGVAPFAEESFFRGFMFTGLLRWTFWPAAALSGFAFTLAHLDPGSVLPFFGVGVLMAWLYWSRGSLWDSIIFHFLFNFTSFLLLAAGS